LKNIFTHYNVDLDAVLSVLAAREFISRSRLARIRFRPANWDGADAEPGDLILDMDANGRGRKGARRDGIVCSCFASIVAEFASADDQRALVPLMTFVDTQDAHGNVVKHLVPNVDCETYDTLSLTSLNAVFRAVQSMSPRNDDFWVIQHMEVIFKGLLKTARARQRAAKEAEGMEILPGGKVALVVNAKEFGTNAALFDHHGIRVIVYVDGCNVGVVREGSETLRMDHPAFRDIVEAAGESAEWFAHEAGFLFCRGSRKAVQTTRSRVNPRQLAEVAAQLLG
jgi:hypothetical protein